MVKGDINAFRQRFSRWKNGELVYLGGRPIELPGYEGGKDELERAIDRFDRKSKEYPQYDELTIPFDKSKKLVLSDAGLATGAIISENLLDSIYKYSKKAELPLKTALGIATKESTLGNPTDDRSLYRLMSDDILLATLRGQTGQHLNTTGANVSARLLVNYYKDSWNPYETAIKFAKRKAAKLVKRPDGNVYDRNGNIIGTRAYHDDPDYINYKNEMALYEDKYNQTVDSILISGEKYADRIAKKNKSSIRGNVLEAAFKDYKINPDNYNPGQKNYRQLVEKRGSEVMRSPQIQQWLKKRGYKDGKDEQELPEGFLFDTQMPELTIYGDVERARRQNNWLINRGLFPRFYSLGNGKGVKEIKIPTEKGLEIVSPEFYALAGLRPGGDIIAPITRNQLKTIGNTIANKSRYWTPIIPENPNMAYRRMGPLERDWLMEGNELSTRATNVLTEAEEAAARAASKTKRFNIFKAGAEHGGRKQFAKGQPWHGTTVTHGEEQVLAIPGRDLPWVSGRHFKGPQGNGFGVGKVSFEDAPFGSHIDLLTEDGFSGVNPSELNGSVIYSPYKIFGHRVGYKKLYPSKTSNKLSTITVENAASLTPEQWTAAQDAAIARGDMSEAQRLRDLHFRVSAPNTKFITQEGNPKHVYHGGQRGITRFLNAKNNHNYENTRHQGYRHPETRSGIYTSDDLSVAKSYKYRGKKGYVYDLYLNAENPFSQSYSRTLINQLKNANPFSNKRYLDPRVIRDRDLETTLKGYDAIIHDNGMENVIWNTNNIKLADAVTYDDNGVRIPLGKRDNFKLSDIRYGLLPFVGITGAAATYEEGYAHGKDSGIHIKPSHRGRLTALKKRTGKSEAELYRTGSPATRKMITFARNARKWRKS